MLLESSVFYATFAQGQSLLVLIESGVSCKSSVGKPRHIQNITQLWINLKVQMLKQQQ